MSFSAFGKQKDETLLTLVSDGRGGVNLCAVDWEGKLLSNGYILRITKDGRLFRHAGVSREIGIKLGREDRIAMLTPCS